MQLMASTYKDETTIQPVFSAAVVHLAGTFLLARYVPLYFTLL